MVIGVLGILAAGLLATIDPLEQLRKGADSNKKTAALEFVNAVTRFYATRSVMPWDDTRYATCSDPSSALLNGMTACITALITEGELKDTFDDDMSSASILAKLYVTGTATAVKVCYDPESKSESRRTETNYSSSAGTDTTCEPTTNTGCYWCAR